MPGRQSSKSPTTSTKNKLSTPRAPLFQSPLGPTMSNTSAHPSYTNPVPSANISSSPSFFTSVKEGIALGIGSSLGNRIISGILGPPEIKSAPVPAPAPAPISPNIYLSPKCDQEQISFDTCIKEHKPISECETKLSLLNKCLSEK